MKIILILAFLCTFLGAQAQLSGELVNSGRKCLTETDFTLSGSQEGVVKYILTVDSKGNVVSETLMKSETTVRSTPSIMKARNFVKTLKFEPGTAYPKFHEVKVLIHIKKD